MKFFMYFHRSENPKIYIFHTPELYGKSSIKKIISEMSNKIKSLYAQMTLQTYVKHRFSVSDLN